MASRPPAPLKIHKDSHVIQKPSSSSAAQLHRSRRPVIIYTKPPKVIHATVHNFKDIVQQYTGRPQSAAKECSSSSSSSSSAPPPPYPPTSPKTTTFDTFSSSSSTSLPDHGIIGGGNDRTVKTAAAAASPDLSIKPLPLPADPFLSDDTNIANLLAPVESIDFLGPWGTPVNPSVAGAETLDSIWTSTYWAQ